MINIMHAGFVVNDISKAGDYLKHEGYKNIYLTTERFAFNSAVIMKYTKRGYTKIELVEYNKGFVEQVYGNHRFHLCIKLCDYVKYYKQYDYTFVCEYRDNITFVYIPEKKILLEVKNGK